MRKPASDHNVHSTYREKLLEHLLVGEILRYLWLRGELAEVLKPEVDATGYDLVLSCGQVIRHVQLKASFSGSSTSSQGIHVALAEKPSGCVVWMLFDQDSLELDSFLWFGSEAGERLPDISARPAVRHSRANAEGEKKERPNLRRVPRGDFEPVDSIAELVGRLFGPTETET